MVDQLPYWMAFTHAKSFSNRRKMDFLIHSVFDNRPLDEALDLVKNNENPGFDFSDKEQAGLLKELEQLPNYSFLLEDLLNQGIKIITIFDQKQYPQILKKNLKRDAPLLLYLKGNSSLLYENTAAIVGARKASSQSLTFTENIAERLVSEQKTIVSGFAKGVDRKALDSALKNQGNSIVVIPQGILTYTSKVYYEHIVAGNVLLLSTYHPKAPWSVGLAMDRNKTIYGLSQDIYVAESDSKGGTWEGVKSGLKMGRSIFIRESLPDEKNANGKLIEMGALPVDINGNSVEYQNKNVMAKEPVREYTQDNIINELVRRIDENNGKSMTISEIKTCLGIPEMDSKILTKLIIDSELFHKSKRGRLNTFTLKKYVGVQGNIFES